MKRIFCLFVLICGIIIAFEANVIAESNFSDPTLVNSSENLVISFVTSKGDASTVVVEFNTTLNKASAEIKGNYSIDNGVTVLNAKLALDLKSVILTTSPMSVRTYLLTVFGVKSNAIPSSSYIPGKVEFFHEGMHEGTVACYNLDSLFMDGLDTLVVDATANHNNGESENGGYTTGGYFGNAMGFDGLKSYVQFLPSPSFNITGNQVSISLWAKLNLLPTELIDAYGPLFDSEADQYVMYEDKGNNQLRFKVTTSEGAERPGISSDDLVTGEWIYLVGVYNGSQIMIYKNGVLKDMHSLCGNIKIDQAATLGKSGTSFFSGSIDQVEIFNVALTAEEILKKYHLKEVPIASFPLSAKPLSESDCSVYPNPSDGQFTIALNSLSYHGAKVELIDLLGRVVFTDRYFSNRIQINLQSVKNGLYLLNISTDTGIYKDRLIIRQDL
ncbi:MAG: LamG-like jellyroll fold domain-containing protein [Bacteroidia bacterium]